MKLLKSRIPFADVVLHWSAVLLHRLTWLDTVSRCFHTMALTLREENFVVIDVGSSVTKAGIGMQDTNKPPSVVGCIYAGKSEKCLRARIL